MIRWLVILLIWAGLGFLAAEPFLRPAAPVTRSAMDDRPAPVGARLGLITVAPPGLSALSETRDRPVFAPSRRPPPLAPPPLKAAPPPPRFDDFRLSGIVRSSAGSLILLQEKATGRMVELREGERIDGWTVTRIDETAARLMSGGREVILSQDARNGAVPSAGGRATRWLPSR